MEKRRVLHITNWYPNDKDPNEAMWIHDQIEALDQFISSDIIHIEVKPSRKWRKKRSLNNVLGSYSYEVPIRFWFLIEIFNSFFLIYVLLFKVKKSDYDLINFHIAYPLCSYLHWFRSWIDKPVVITEHWSAYHYHFNVSEDKPLSRIKRIFRKDPVPLITVSRSLKNDIERFAGRELKGYILPNVVRTSEAIDRSEEKDEEGLHRFLMVGSWRSPKRPILAVRSFLNVFAGRNDVELRIAGYGDLYARIEKEVMTSPSSSKVTLLGKLEREEVQREMELADGFIHCSDYETFSVVCAEALAHGTPVLASNRGGIREYLDKDAGLLVDRNEASDWESALQLFYHHFILEDKAAKDKRAKVYQDRFSDQKIGRRYADILLEVIDDLHHGTPI